jgi:hypothetical protein
VRGAISNGRPYRDLIEAEKGEGKAHACVNELMASSIILKGNA